MFFCLYSKREGALPMVIGEGGVEATPVSQQREAAGRIAVLLLAGHALRSMSTTRRRTIVLPRKIAIGRGGPNSWSSFPFNDPLMSNQHARLVSSAAGEYFVQDCGSTNGTWLDGACIRSGPARKLRTGSVLMVGGHVFVFRQVTPDELAAMHEDWDCPFAPVPTLSPTMAVIARKLRQLAVANFDMLLSGETGVGKEVHAEAIHRASGRKGPFVAINCAAIPDYLLESELFGFARGAHSTANRPKAGLIEQANGGTLFLDEIGEMSYFAQAKLLRFLQDRRLLSLGTTRPRTLDVLVVAATHRVPAPDQPATEGLRYDLAARLGPEPVNLPPLKARAEDVGLLTGFFAKGEGEFTPEAYLSLFLHAWKGNVRELEKVIKVARVLAAGCPAIGLDHLPRPLAAWFDSDQAKTPTPRQRPTRDELLALLGHHEGDVASLARELGRQRTLVWRWLRKYELRPSDFRETIPRMPVAVGGPS
jgi:pSer/pThr/pTyr-binding forkhead associated (FHA) protein